MYEASGVPFKSPSPRAFVQVQVRLRSREPLRAARIRDLQLRFEPPLVDKMVGEIWPVWQVEPGVEQDFVLYLRPEFAAGIHPGFDRLRLRSSSATPIELLSVRSGGDTALRAGAGRKLWPGELILEPGAERRGRAGFSQTGLARQPHLRDQIPHQGLLAKHDLHRRARAGEPTGPSAVGQRRRRLKSCF